MGTVNYFVALQCKAINHYLWVRVAQENWRTLNPHKQWWFQSIQFKRKKVQCCINNGQLQNLIFSWCSLFWKFNIFWQNEVKIWHIVQLFTKALQELCILEGVNTINSITKYVLVDSGSLPNGCNSMHNKIPKHTGYIHTNLINFYHYLRTAFLVDCASC